jgi:hypothetical protein
MADEPKESWPKGSRMGLKKEDKQDKPRRIPFPAPSDPRKLMPIRCPLPDHDKHSGMPLRFGTIPSPGEAGHYLGVTRTLVC